MGSLRIPHSEDVPTIQTAGSQMSFVLQPFNYFDSDPSQHVDDALTVLTDTDAGRLAYQRQGDLDDLGGVVSRDLDCLPIMVRNSAGAGDVTGVMMTSLLTLIYALR